MVSIRILWTVFLVSMLLVIPALASSELDNKLDNLTQQIINDFIENNKSTIAVIEFSDIDGKTTAFGKYLGEELITRLVRSKKFRVVERELLEKVLKEHKLNLSGLIDSASAIQLGRLLGVNAIVTGTVAELDQSVKINARLIAAETGGIMTVAAVEVKKDGDVIKLLNRTFSKSEPDLSPDNLKTNSSNSSEPIAPISIPETSPIPTLAAKTTPDGSDIPSFTMTESFTLNEQARMFAGPILARYLYLQPDYGDGFNRNKYPWAIKNPNTGAGEYVFENSGGYRISAFPFKSCVLSAPDNLSELSDVILEVDAQFVNHDQGDWRLNIREGSKSEFTIIFEGKTAGLTLMQEKRNKKFFTSPPNPFIKSGLAVNHVKVIVKSSEIAVFVNREIIAYVKEPNYSKASSRGKISFQVSNPSSTPLQVKFSNLIIWDINIIPPW